MGVLLGALAAPGTLRAQAPSIPEYYSPRREFKIPFTPPGDSRVVQVLLYVSTDGKTWKQAATANPDARVFYFTATDDGCFWFTTQTQDADNRRVPANPTQFQPLEKVCVDTVKPVIALRQVTPREGTVAVEWDVQDANLDAMSLRIHYRPWGSQNAREWIELQIPPIAHGEKSWTPPRTDIPLEVHLWARDKAGNTAEQAIQVTPGRAPAGPGAAQPPLRHVKGREFQLGCTIANQGESGVEGIDVWVLRDNVWRNFKPGPNEYKIDGERATVKVKVASAGRWGFTLIPRSGVGLAHPPPRTGDPPQIWIEVDETKPIVTNLSAVVGQGPQDLGRLTVYWTASDVHLAAKPITIFYSTTGADPWIPLVKQIDNTGVYSVETKKEGTPKLPFQFYLKVEAVDEAGNVGSAVTQKTVKIDPKIPTPENVDVVPQGPQGETSPNPPHVPMGGQ
jgi:hypothetical protein